MLRFTLVSHHPVAAGVALASASFYSVVLFLVFRLCRGAVSDIPTPTRPPGEKESGERKTVVIPRWVGAVPPIPCLAREFPCDCAFCAAWQKQLKAESVAVQAGGPQAANSTFRQQWDRMGSTYAVTRRAS
jgi:hypothetical protein